MMGTDASQYDRAKGSAGDADPAVRTALAANPETPPEILYFLAKDEAVAVRRAVAANPATPHQADIILAKDRDYGVRCELARKAVGEGLAVDKRRELWRMGFTILETLATDKVVRVRRALAEAIKSLVGAPRPVILRLARDTDREVAAPILRHSPVLTGKDLVKIVGPGAPEWAQKAVADRADISPDVADVVVASGSIPSITRLLKNTRARIRDETIERVVERAEDVAEWHEPLVRRPGLTTRAILGLARFVATPLQSVLRGRPNVDPGTAAELDRIAETRPGKSRADDVTAPSGSDTSRRSGSAQSLESPEVRAKRLFTDGKLTDDAVQTALQLGDYEMVTAALSLRARIPLDIVERILDMENARAVTALCWKGGYKMRFALEVQKRIARIPSGRLLYARDGYDYPLPQSEMEYQLALFGE